LPYLFARGEYALDAGERQGERPLAEDVHAGGERRRYVDFVQMIGRADHHDVDVGVAQDFLDVVVGVFSPRAGSERLCFPDVVVHRSRRLRPRGAF